MPKSFRTGTAILTFCLGVTATIPLSVFQTQESESAPAVEERPISTTACGMMGEEDLYDGKTVSFPATAYRIFDGEIILNPLPFEQCDSPKHGLTFSPQLEMTPNPITAQLVEDLSKGRVEVDVLVLGTATSFYVTRKHKGYLITPTKIQLISALKVSIIK